MKQLYIAFLASLPLIMGCGGNSNDTPTPTETSKTTVLKLDSYTEGGPRTPQSGLVAKESGAVTLGGLENQCTLKKVIFFYGGGPAATERDINIVIFKDDGTSILPNAEIFNEPYHITALNDKLIEIDVSDKNIKFAAGEYFRLGIKISQGSVPTLAVDTDGTIDEAKNWIQAANANWKRSSSLGTKGDWIIRAEVEENLQ